MRMRAEHLRPHGWQPGRTLHIPGLVRLHDRVRAGAGGRGLVAARADLGARPGGESAAAVRAARAALTTFRDRPAREFDIKTIEARRTSMARRDA